MCKFRKNHVKLYEQKTRYILLRYDYINKFDPIFKDMYFYLARIEGIRLQFSCFNDILIFFGLYEVSFSIKRPGLNFSTKLSIKRPGFISSFESLSTRKSGKSKKSILKVC